MTMRFWLDLCKSRVQRLDLGLEVKDLKLDLKLVNNAHREILGFGSSTLMLGQKTQDLFTMFLQ